MGDAIFARNFGKGSEWVEGIIKEVLGMKNYLVTVSINGNLTWKRHETQIFSRVIFPESQDRDISVSNVPPDKTIHFDQLNTSQIEGNKHDVNENTSQNDENKVIDVNKDPPFKTNNDNLIPVRRSQRIPKKPKRLTL